MAIPPIPWWFPVIFFAVSATAYTDLSTDTWALLTFKSRLLDDSSLNWYDNTTSLVCNWTGITCGSRHRRVTGLDLSGMGLSGSLPPEIGNLTFLVNLNLTNNRFNGYLPEELSRLRRLKYMDFSVNELRGELPSSIGFLSELRTLRLHNNSFTGLLPHSLVNASKLERLVLMYNDIGGELPPQIFNLSSLILLNLLGNRFSGTIPSEICSGIPNIRFLVLRNNGFHGQIPSNFSGCSQLQLISLAENQFSGSIPSDMISHSSQLRMIYLYRNQLVGQLPRNIGDCRALEVLDVHRNNITGTIPSGLANLTNLQVLDLSSNQLTGIIPKDLGKLVNLEYVSLGNNILTAGIPMDMFNISTLQTLSVTRNKLTGKLPMNFCAGLPILVELYLDRNEFFGQIPLSISNCTNLMIIDIGVNKFSGIIPRTIGDLIFLERLVLPQNDFICESSECSFLTALTNCRHLQMLELSYNPFGSYIPLSVGNLSTSLQDFRCYNCGFIGTVPLEFGNLTQIFELNLGNNNLIGSIPITIQKLRNLQGFFLDYNNISGFLPEFLCELQSLSVIYLDRNHITGNIPTCIGNLTALRRFSFAYNRLDSTIPTSLWHLNNVLEFNLSSNFLNGSLSSDIGNLDGIYLFDLSANRFSGHIPSSISDMNVLTYLSLASNDLEGVIPESIGTLLSLQHVDLSHNRLSGNIPMTLQRIASLVYFDVSFNNLSGLIPSEGPFRNFSYSNFDSNEGLCGESRFGVRSCKVLNNGSHHRNVFLLVVYIFSGIFGVCFSMILLYKWCSRIRKKDDVQVEENHLLAPNHVRISYYDIVQATENFNTDHLLGTGAFSYVYKGILHNEKAVAIKVFNLQLEVATRSFDVECEVFRNLRHRNLCKVISVCSNDTFKAIVMEHMENGSLEKWLYSEDRFLSISKRFSIMIDIASALDYLHEGYTTPIVHCDVKPSNMLLDDNMIGYLSDFGIAKLLGEIDIFVHTATLATTGYIAPEYGSSGLVSTKCDVYSFGIVLMEVFTGKKPGDERFRQDLSLRNMVRDFIRGDDILEIIDPRLLDYNEMEFPEKVECVSWVLELALKCSCDNPNERVNMKHVVSSLKSMFSKLS